MRKDTMEMLEQRSFNFGKSEDLSDMVAKMLIIHNHVTGEMPDVPLIMLQKESLINIIEAILKHYDLVKERLEILDLMSDSEVAEYVERSLNSGKEII